MKKAKELVDNGYDVTLVENSPTLANGATIRNEGWLHAGTYHSVAVEDDGEIERVIANTLMGHRAIATFAPEAIDHITSYAVVASDDFAHRAVTRWTMAGVPFQEVPLDQLAEEGLDTQRFRASFLVEDKSVNSRILCQKLAAYIQGKGGNFLLGARFTPQDEERAKVDTSFGRLELHSRHFVIAAGSGCQNIVEGITGEPFPMRFFKAHLLVSPRLTEHNYFHLEAGEAGFMNHGLASVIGIHRDGVEMEKADYTVDPNKERLIYEAVSRMVPHAAHNSPGGKQNSNCSVQ
jgi:glycine/D-amino acid oxidase-like deaminating enzyme